MSRAEVSSAFGSEVARAGVVLALSVLVLFALDIARAHVGRGLRPAQYAMGVLVVLAFVRLLQARGLRRSEWLPWAALAALLVPTAVDHARHLEPGDSIHYYSYLHSVLFDLDLDLRNDYRLLGWAHPEMPNVLPVGAPLAWAPLLLPVHLVRQAARLFGMGAPTGAEPLYQASVAFATFLYGAAALFLLFDVLRRFAPPAAAFWATVLAWVGTPFRFYLAVLPGMAHVLELFAAVLVLRASLALRDLSGRREAALAGAACGLVFLARSQDGLLLLLPGLFLAFQFLRGDRPGALRRLCWLLAGFVMAALPQLVVWQIQFGVPLLVPHAALHGDAFLHPRDPQLAGALLSPRGGLLVSHPVFLAALPGLLALGLRDARYVLAVIPVLLATWYLNASVFDWYHVRRYTGIVPLLAPGLAFFLTPLVRAGWLPLAVLAFLVLRYDLAVDRLRAVPGQPAPLGAVLGEVAERGAADLYAGLERASPRAAVAVLGAYTGDSVLADPVTVIPLGGSHSVLRLPRAARNLSLPDVEDGLPCRWVTDRDARLFLPVARGGAALLTIHARALETDAPQTMEVLWNEQPLLSLPMSAAWLDYRVPVPAALVHPGTNVLTLRFARGPIYHRARGRGPREVRPAALHTLTLQSY